MINKKGHKVERISPTIEEGMYFNFRENDYVFNLEFYNDGDIGYIVSNDKTRKSYENEDIKFDEVTSKIEEFFEKYRKYNKRI